MRLGTKTRYAVMAMVDLAACCGGPPVALTDIGGRQEISCAYLEQIFAKLKLAGLVCSVRGPGGGYRLARPPECIRVADIILAVEEPVRATRCDEEAAAPCRSDQRRCATHDLWAALGDHINRFLEGVSIADICAGRVPAGRGPAPREIIPHEPVSCEPALAGHDCGTGG